MSLTLTIIKSPKGIAQVADVKVFPVEGGSLGRGEDNTWVLPDPDRFLSSRHCEIRFENGQHYILDQSTNGTFVNGASEPVGKGGRVPLKNGDMFEVGEYQFSVSLEDSLLIGDPFGSPFAPGAPVEDSQFSTDSPFAEGVRFGEGLSLSPDAEGQDPLRALDEAGGGDPFANPMSAPSAFPIDDPFKSQPQETYKGGSFGDGADPMSQSVEWPSASQQNVIPEDWDEDFLGEPTGGVFPPSAAAPPPVPQAPKPKRPVKPAQPAAERAEVINKARQELKRPTKPEPARAAVKPQPGGGLVIDTLIEAMGLDSKNFSDDQKREVGRVAGQLLREATVGMMQLLRSRTSLKNEFRMNVTTIQPIENNPLKFSANVDEALENMFVRQSSAYKPPVDSFREGYQSIAEHQVAMIAGVRSAFKSIMENFNPERLAKNFGQGKKGAGIPVVQKAKNWTAYSEYYANLAEDMEHTFQHLFGDDFVQAYEEQMSKLAAQRKNNT